MNIEILCLKLRDLFSVKGIDTSSAEGRSKERYRLIALSGSSSLIAKLITSSIGLVSAPITINYLGKEQFGLWMIISSLVLWIQLSDFGIVNGLTNALSEAYGKDDKVSACGYISSAFIVTGFISLIFVPIILLTSKWIPWGTLLNTKDPSMSSMANDCFLVASIAFIINLPISLINRIYISSQLGYITNVINIFSSIISLLGILISVHMKLGMQYLILIVSSGPIIANIGAWLYMPRVLPWYKVNMGLVSMSALQRVARSSIPLFMFQIGSLLVNEMVNIVIAQVGTLNMVADYNVLLRIYLVIFSLGLGLSSPFYPAIRDAYERKEKFWIVQSIYRLIKIRTAIIFIPAVILLIGGDWLIKAWIRLPLDSQFGIIGWSVFLLTLFLSSIGSSFGEILLGLDVIWSQVWLVFLSAIIIIIAMYCFIPKFGLAGIFISTALSTIYPMFWGGNKLKKVLQGI